jgi:aryl-alcohol dehydrogenase-like predicted oxidoreductase
MNKECAEIFYLHAPDPDVPVEETLAEVRSFVKSCVRSCTLLARASMAATDQAVSWLADALGWSGAAQVQKLYAEGKFQQLGLSNYQSWEVVHIYHHMLSNGWVLPTIYQVKVRSHCRFRNRCTDSLSESGIKRMRAVVQSGNATEPCGQGMYNALTREIEDELLPALSKLGIRFVAYNPLAAGALSRLHSKHARASGRQCSTQGRHTQDK